MRYERDLTTTKCGDRGQRWHGQERASQRGKDGKSIGELEERE